MGQENLQWQHFFDSKQAGELLEKKGALRALAESQEIQGLAALLASRGEAAQSASNAAILGDTRAFAQILEEISCDPSGAEIVARLKKSLGR